MNAVTCPTCTVHLQLGATAAEAMSLFVEGQGYKLRIGSFCYDGCFFCHTCRVHWFTLCGITILQSAYCDCGFEVPMMGNGERILLSSFVPCCRSCPSRYVKLFLPKSVTKY